MTRRHATIESIFRDQALHAVNKPAGMSSVSERWDPTLPTVVQTLWQIWQEEDAEALKPHLVHRLDKDTTGVIVFACNRPAQVDLRRQFREREVTKSYLALVHGAPRPGCGTIDIKIADDPRKAGRMMQSRGGKSCRTDYETIEEFRGVSLVRLFPHTGRTHQIRVSLQSIGHPCAVDPLYGSADGLLLSTWKKNYKSGRGQPERAIIDRLTLHAERLEIRHPLTGEPMDLRAPLAKDLDSTLRQLRRWGRC